jgi:hypothetical protein
MVIQGETFVPTQFLTQSRISEEKTFSFQSSSNDFFFFSPCELVMTTIFAWQKMTNRCKKVRGWEQDKGAMNYTCALCLLSLVLIAWMEFTLINWNAREQDNAIQSHQDGSSVCVVLVMLYIVYHLMDILPLPSLCVCVCVSEIEYTTFACRWKHSGSLVLWVDL